MTEAELLRTLQGARTNKAVSNKIYQHSIGTLCMELGWAEQNAHNFLADAVHKDLIPGHDRLVDWEASLYVRAPMPAMTNLDAAMKRRADHAYARLHPCLSGVGDMSVLDLGGGSGEIGMRIAAEGHKVTIADIRDWRRDPGALDFVQIVGNTVAAEDASFDVVVVLHVFHHSNDPEALLKEAFRVARRGVIFIESVTNDLDEYIYTCWQDWFYNRVLHFSRDPAQKVPVPCRFFPAVGWEQMVYRLYGTLPRVSKSLGIYQPLSPIHHHLLVFDK